jgi:hypothetical protein
MRKTTYKPKFTLSVKYLKMIMTEDEYVKLLNRYTRAKEWGNRKEIKHNGYGVFE